MATSPHDHEFRSSQPANTRYLQSQIFDLFHWWIFDHTNLKFTMKEKCKEFPRLPNQNDQSVKMHRCHPKWMRPLGSGQIWRQSTIRGDGAILGRGSWAYHGELRFLAHRWSVHFWLERDICNSDQPSCLVWWSEIWYARVCQKCTVGWIIHLRWHQPSTWLGLLTYLVNAFRPVWIPMTRGYFY